jgi:hypothetical protein
VPTEMGILIKDEAGLALYSRGARPAAATGGRP